MTSSKKDKFDCAEIENYVQQYLDGMLSEEDKYLFDEHLDYCLPCDKKIEFEKKLKDIVRLKIKQAIPEDQINNRIDNMLNDLQ
jgi:anti-sigma factor (TIGR02949 family)